MKHRTFVLCAALAVVTTIAVAHISRAAPPQTDKPDASHGKVGITHKALFRTDLDRSNGLEVIVWDTEYAPRAINPRHYHPAAITFHVISGRGVWQEDGKAAVTLRAGDSLFVPAGTTHTHWNPSYTERLRLLEFIVGDKNKARPEVRPYSNRGAVPR